jgi:hypothetical protein
VKSFTKLFASIVSSSIWTEDAETRVVWVTMLALADKDGEVWASVGGLAKQAGVSREKCASALAKFMAPDPDSRTKDNEGRRIAEIDGGWVLLNYAKYRELGRGEDRREYFAEYKRKQRAEGRPDGPCAYCGSANVTGHDHIIPISKGGLDKNENLVPCCRSCNASKKAFTIWEWFHETTITTGASLNIALKDPKIRAAYEAEKSTMSTKCPTLSPIAEAEAEAEAKADKEKDSSPKAAKKLVDQDLFDEFWDAYGKKVGKAEAMAAWGKLSAQDRQDAAAGAADYALAHPEVQYRLDPVRYLKRRRWQDEIGQPEEAQEAKPKKFVPNMPTDEQIEECLRIQKILDAGGKL